MCFVESSHINMNFCLLSEISYLVRRTGQIPIKTTRLYEVSCPLTISYKRTSITSNYCPPLDQRIQINSSNFNSNVSEIHPWLIINWESEFMPLKRYFLFSCYTDITRLTIHVRWIDSCSRFTFFYRTICRKFVYWPLRYDHSTR